MKDFVVMAVICLAASAVWPLWVDSRHSYSASADSVAAVQSVAKTPAVHAEQMQVSVADFSTNR